MVKPCLILLLCLLPLLLAAQSEDGYYTDLELEPIADFEDYRILYFERLMGALEGSKSSLHLRSELSAEEQQLFLAGGLGSLRAEFRSTREDAVYSSYSLALSTPEAFLREFRLGALRYDFGLGLVSGTATRKSDIYSLRSTGHPEYYYPRGAAAVMQISHWQTSLFYSRQDRALDASQKLTRSRHESLDSTTEEIYAGGIARKLGRLKLGSLIYHQGYASPALEAQSFSAYSLSADYAVTQHRLSSELAILDGRSTAKLIWDYSVPSFFHRAGISSADRDIRPTYAAKLHGLRSIQSGTEIFQEIRHSPIDHLAWSLGYRLNRAREFTEKHRYLSLLSASIAYRDSLSRAIFSLKHLDREILVPADSSYHASNPYHLRFGLDLRRKLEHDLSFALALRYHLEETGTYESNAAWWSAALAWDPGALGITAKLQSWQTVREFFLFETDVHGDEYLLSTSTKDELRLSLAIRYQAPRLSLESLAVVSLLSQELTDLRLKLSYRL